MGVIYKLKDDIVQYIVRKKQENPAISCRQLVVTIQEAFQVDVCTLKLRRHMTANESNAGRAPAV